MSFFSQNSSHASLKICIASLFTFCTLLLHAQEASLDSINKPSVDTDSCNYHYSFGKIVLPGSLIVVGGAFATDHFVDTSSRRERRFYFDDKIQYLPIVAYAGLGFIPGIKHRSNFGERMLAGCTSYIILTAVTQGLKNIVKEPRPDTGAKTSFPSGHTATAFCGAELTRIEYGNIYGAAAYIVAAATGVMRVVNNRHWCSDVLAGAGIGILSARAGYWLVPWEKRICQRIFHKKSSNGATDKSTPYYVLTPTYDIQYKAMGFSLSMIL